ncbi:MAG: ABC transporter substrate-binding protein, partial [Chloroflexota bacterium]|nr:ABC transporter substrate-binding protein [Chloroflexota bacterium]
PLLDKVIVRLIAEESSRISALEAGDVDMLDIAPPIGIEQLKENTDIVLVESPGTNWYGLTMNQKRPPWDKPEARMAVAKAFDRQDFVAKALFGLAVPSVGPLAPAFGWVYRPPEDVDDPQAFNLDEAKALAEQAGLSGLKPILIAGSDDPRPAQVARGVLAEIGLDVQIEQAQTAAYVERRTAGDYDMTFLGSVVDADPDDGVWNYFHSEGPSNSNGYNNPKADELVDGQRRTADQAERQRLLHELQTLVASDAVYAFLYHEPDRTAFYDYVKGYVPIPEQRYLEKVWLDK